MKKILVKYIALFAFAGVTGAANAGLLIDAGANSTLQTFGIGNYVAGTEFTLSSSFTIDGLGYIDTGSDGLLNSHRVGLWSNSDQSLLAEALVTNASTIASSASSLGRWYIEAITPLLLGPGSYRVAALVSGDRGALSNDKIGNGVTLSSGYVRTSFPNGGFAYPGFSFSSNAIRATLTSDFFGDEVTVPAPATLALFGLGLAGLGWSRRKKA